MPEKRYRVLFVASHPVQYQSPIFRRLALHPELDVHVAYCTLKGAEASLDPGFGATFKWDVPLLDGYTWSEVLNLGSGNESFFGLYNPRLWTLIRTGNYDAVVCYVGYVRASFWIAYLAAKLSHAAFIFGTDTASLEPRDGRRWKVSVKSIFWPWLFSLADQVIVPSSASVQMMRQLTIPDDKISLTPFVVDNEGWRTRAAMADRSATRKSWGVADTHLVILFCAKLQPWKRPLDLLHAFAEANVPQSILILAGEGPLRTQLEKQAASLGVSSRVRFLGFVNQSLLPAVYGAADLMVLPSAFEPFGVVVNEAMSCGCPVLVSDQVGAGPDLVAPVNPEFIFPSGDVDAIARLLCGAARDLAHLREIRSSCVAQIQNWSPEQNVAATVEAVRAAVTRKSVSSPGNTISATHSRTPVTQKPRE